MRLAAGLLYVSALCSYGAGPPAVSRPTTHPSLAPLQKEGIRLFHAGRYHEASIVFEKGLREARRLGHQTSIARLLQNVASCDLAAFQYRKAMRAYLEAAALAERANDLAGAGVVYSNIANIYGALGALPEACAAAGRALKFSEAGESPFVAPVRVGAASLRAVSGDFQGAIPEFRRAIEEAERAQDLGTQAAAWNDLGELYVRRGELAAAERAIDQDLKLRHAGAGRSLDVAYRNQALLRQAKGDLELAAESFRAAIRIARQESHAVVLIETHSLFGDLCRRQGRPEQALGEYGAAIGIVRRWRMEALPADAIRSSAQAGLHGIYSRFAETAAELSFRASRPELASQALEALEENRAAGLRALPTDLAGWQRRLPREFGEKLAALQAAEAKLLAGDLPDVRRECDRLRADLVQLEAAAGLAGASERRAGRGSLRDRLRGQLRDDQVLLSFHLGESASYLWAACRHRTYVRRLPPKRVLVPRVRAFTDAVSRGAEAAARLGSALFEDLFGGLEKTLERHPRVLLSLDDALFELPFAALVERTEGGRPVYMIEAREMQIVPSGFLIAQAWPGPRQVGFLGVDDAVYNAADPRWTGPRKPPGGSVFLSRLPGSVREVKECARSWAGPAVLLQGPEASRAALRAEIQNGAAVFHFAGHVVRGPRRQDSGLMALSLAPNGLPELLAPAEIASWRVRTRVVVLSACSSGRGEALPGAGLTGLTRAWLAAGAGSVVATLWPTPDDNGRLLESFYGFLRRDPLQRPAAALREAQRRMIASGTWRAHPKHWAAYFALSREGH